MKDGDTSFANISEEIQRLREQTELNMSKNDKDDDKNKK